MVDRKAVTILEGSDQLRTYQSSPGKTRYYCQNCYSQIYHVKDEQLEMVTLKVGLLDNSDSLAQLPHKHIHQDSDWAWLREEE
ncbi:GFA family protein [Streptococcus pluranimalium]|nr:GFA family protein [Streptococcus pluranimalium]